MKQLAILIPTLPVRIDSYSYLIRKLNKQIIENDLADHVQIVSICDTKDYLIGFKRNFLLKLSMSKYICFIDDDDDISDYYVKMLYEATLTNPDCVSFLGQYTDNCMTKLIDISIEHGENKNDHNCFYRIPNHLSVVRRDIALKCLFPNKQYGEDSEYAFALKKYLKKEHKINKVLYFYNYNQENSQTFPSKKNNGFI